MTDADYKKHKSRIVKCLDKWVEPMGLKWFKIDLTFERGFGEGGMAGETNMASWRYREFDITFYLGSTSQMSEQELEDLVVHELSHCLLAALSCNLVGTDDNDNYRRDLMEFNTSLVAAALAWVRTAGIEEGEKRAMLKKHKENSNNVKI